MNANWIEENSTTTGTGTLTLAGRAAGLAAFGDVLSDLSVVRYVIEASNGDKEEGVGTFTLSGTTLSRDLIINTWIDSTTTFDSSSPAALTLPAGAHTVIIAPTANSTQPVPMSRRNGTRIISANIPNTDATSAGTLTANRHYTIPFLLTEPVTATKIGIWIDTGVDATTTRLGLSRIGSDSLGIDMLIDVTISATTVQNSTAQEGAFTAVDLMPAWYMVHFNSTGGIRVGNTSNTTGGAAYPLQNMASSNRLFPSAYQYAASTGGNFNAPEDQTTVSTSATAHPIIWLGE